MSVQGTTRVHGRDVSHTARQGEGTPIVLVHGLAASSANWGTLPDRLHHAGRTVITIDLPGHGASQHNPGRQALPDLADALRQVLDDLDVPTAHLVGHSLGGAVVTLYAHGNPDRYASLTLDAAAGLGPGAAALLRGGLLPGADLAMRAVVTKPAVASMRAVAAALRRVGVRPYELSDSVIDVIGGLTDPEHQDGFMETLHCALRHEGHPDTLLGELADLPGETISIVWCAVDPVLPVTHAHEAHARLANSHLTVLSGYSHEPHTAHPGEFAATVLDHVARCEGRDAPGLPDRAAALRIRVPRHTSGTARRR